MGNRISSDWAVNANPESNAAVELAYSTISVPSQFRDTAPIIRGAAIEIRADIAEFELIMGTSDSEAVLELSRDNRAEIQLRLRLLGHDPGSTDGSFGRNSRRAISAWQLAVGVESSGYFSETQVARLELDSDQVFLDWQIENPGETILRVPVQRPGKTRRRKNSGDVSLGADR